MGIFSSKKTTTLEPMLTNEQKSAQSQLMNLGQLYDLSGFNFNMTPSEMTGNNILSSYLTSGTGALDTSRNVLTEMANQTFNPDDPSSGFAAFSRQLARSGKTASDAMNRDAAIGGNRFGTAIGRDKANLAAQQTDILGSKLAELWQATQGNKLSAAQGLGQVQELENAMTQSKLSAAYNYGSLQRDLQNQKANLAYDEWKRANEERISGLNSVWGRGVDYGAKSYTSSSPTLLGSLASSVLGGVGSSLGTMASGGLSKLFSSFGSSSGSGVNINAGGGGGYSGLMSSGSGVGSGLFI